MFCGLEQNYSVKVFVGKEAMPFCEIVSLQVMQAFAEYPYLYSGTLEGDIEYFNTWLAKGDPALALVFYNNEPIASMKGYSLETYLNPQARDLFLAEQIDIAQFYYITDLAVIPAHRGNHISRMLINALEEYAKTAGYNCACLTTEKGDQNDFLMPENYTSRTYYYAGYAQTFFYMVKEWPTFQSDGTIKLQDHKLDFWFKDLQD